MPECEPSSTEPRTRDDPGVSRAACHGRRVRSRDEDARHLPDGGARDAGARAGGGRGRRRHRRARLPVLRPARGRAGDPPRGRAGAAARDAHARMPRRPRAHARARARQAAHPDDVLVAPRGVRLGALRGRPARLGRHEHDRRRPPRGRAARGAARPARRADLDRRAHPLRGRADRRLALPRHAHRHDRRARRPLPRARRARRARAALVDVPLYAGFGITTPEHARAAAELADGIVVGSRAVEVAEEGPARAPRLRRVAPRGARLQAIRRAAGAHATLERAASSATRPVAQRPHDSRRVAC